MVELLESDGFVMLDVFRIVQVEVNTVWLSYGVVFIGID
jgi:hypothetical protein